MSIVEEYYDSIVEDEWERLERHKVEFDITKRYLEEYINEPSKILDVGGGPGRYSIFLAENGYDVTLLDLSSENISLARKKSTEADVEIKKFVHANALEMSDCISEKFDVVLCMGPMYHLVDKNDRINVIRECMKRLKEGGLLFVAFISSYAPIIDLIKNYPESIVDNKENTLNFLKDGKNIVNEDNSGFTNAFFINPLEIELFMDKFSLDKKVITGVEGLPGQSEEKLNSLSEEAYQEWIDLIYRTSTNPMTWASCEHFLYIGEKIKK